MRKVPPDRVIEALTAIASFAYFGMWVGAFLVLTALPVVRLFGGADGHFHYGLGLPVSVGDPPPVVQTVWGPAPLKLDRVRAVLQLPIPMLPWSLVAVLWGYAAA